MALSKNEMRDLEQRSSLPNGEELNVERKLTLLTFIEESLFVDDKLNEDFYEKVHSLGLSPEESNFVAETLLSTIRQNGRKGDQQ
jgi:hypothetical protein